MAYLKYRNAKDLLLSPTASLRDALIVINKFKEKAAIIVDHNRRFLGIINDDDLHRHLIRGVSISDNISTLYRTDALVAKPDDSGEALLMIMRKHDISFVTIVDDKQQFLGIFDGNSLSHTLRPNLPVLIMAGGFGTRLRPETDTRPKPMIEINGKPLLEKIILKLISQGFKTFYISVHYLADAIKSHFGDGHSMGCSITYIEETKPLGTAGSLALLPKSVEGDIVVMNGDLLTDLDFGEFVRYHKDKSSDLTMCGKDFEIQIPYGVIAHTNGYTLAIEEKPTVKYQINCGAYVISQFARSLIKPYVYLQMTDLINRLLDQNHPVGFSKPIVNGLILAILTICKLHVLP